MNAIEGIVFAAEAVLHMGSAEAPPVESVGPTVIAALDASVEMSFGAGADAGAAMPAHVEKRPQRAIFVASNDDAFIRDRAQKIVARRRHLIGAADADPGLAVEAFQFVAEKVGVRVVAGWQRRSNGFCVRRRHSGTSQSGEVRFVYPPGIGAGLG